MRPVAVTLALAFVAAVPTLAHAQSADAGKLFDEGKALMKEHAFAAACYKFEQSDKLDPGVGNELWLADCYEQSGKLAAAYKQYSATEKLAASLQDHRDDVAHKRASALLAKLSKLVVTLPAAHPVDGIELRVDGAIAPLGDSIAVDPGTHLVEASAPGYEHWESKVLVGSDAATVGVVVEPIARKVVEAAAPAAETPPAPPVPVSKAPENVTGRSPLRVAAPVVGAVGLVGLGFGTAFALLAQSDRNERQSASTADVASTVSFVASGLLIGAAVTMFLVTPPTKSEKFAAFAPAVSPTFAGVVGQGRF